MIVETSNTRHPRGAAEPGRGAPPTSAAPESAPTGRGFDILEVVKDDLRVVRLESGQVLFSEGDAATCMYVLKSGRLRIRSGSVVYEDVAPGGIVGEMGLVEDHQPRSAMVYALAESELVEIDDVRFSELIARTPRFALTVMQVLSRRLRAMDRRYRPDPRV